MLPIGPKPILEININRAKAFGFDRHFLMVGYMADTIRSYFRDGSSLGVELLYFEEEEPKGTAGPLSSIEGLVTEPFLVMNADVLTEFKLGKLLEVHKSGGSVITVGLKELRLDIPYGIAELGENEEIVHIREKPTMEFLINAGIYCVSPEALNLIPPTGIYHMTHLIEDARREGMKVLGLRFDESWRDIGRLDDYIDTVQENEKGIRFDRFD